MRYSKIDFATNVGDAGLRHLHGLKQLRKLYLWQSQVTDDGEAALQNVIPELEIVRDLSMPIPVPPKTEDKDEDQPANPQDSSEEPAEDAETEDKAEDGDKAEGDGAE